MLFLSVTIVLTDCSPSQQAINYSINAEGIIEAQPDTMVKDAIRLKGKVLNNGKTMSDRLQYQFEVIDVVKRGATFSTLEPEIGEKVMLITTQEVKFKKGNEVILDATTSEKKEDGVLWINMIIE